MEKVLKIGIIGCGAIGKDHCRRIIETVPGATVVAVSDYVAAAADDTAAKYGIKSYGNDCDGMIKDPEVEAVVITSIDPTHHDYVMKTLAEEKWCFCEKPLSQNAADCEDIIKREQEIGKRLVQVGFMRHYDRGYAEMKRIIDSAHREGIGVSVCGELAADPYGLALLLGMGVDTLSASPRFVPGMKHMIRRLDAQTCMDMAHSVLMSTDVTASQRMLRERLQESLGSELAFHTTSIMTNS